MDDDNKKLALLEEIAKMYYEQGKTAAEIARMKSVSPEEILLWLEEARREDIVHTIVRKPLITNSSLADRLIERFKLKDARILSRENRSYAETIEDIGVLGAQYFQKEITPTSIIGISWGSALYHLINAIHPVCLPNAEVVQLIGASGNENNPTDGPILAQLLANRLGCKCRYLYAPLLVANEKGREALLEEKSIWETLHRAENAEIALVGIGTTDPEFNSLLRAGYFNLKTLEDIIASGAVGDVCAQHFNANGEWLDIEINRRIIGVSPYVLRSIPMVIGVAAGPKKVTSILAALRGQYVNVLITDDETAQAILEQDIRGMAKPVPVLKAKEKTPTVSLKGIWKVFDGVAVLKGVDIDLYPGEIHALVGGNGSGKSTLMKILSGVYSADAGLMTIDNSPILIHNPAEGHKKGIYYVPQEPKIFPHLSVWENLTIGTEFTYNQVKEKVDWLIDLLHFEGNINEPAGTLNIANQQLLEIMRGLMRDVRVLILDEPTSTLTFREVDLLFKRMQTLASQGIGIFFISHRLNEILEIADRVSVLRDGKLVLSSPKNEINSRALIRAMLPEDYQNGEGNRDSHPTIKHTNGKVLLDVVNLRGEMFDGVNLSVKEGEIVGLTGLVGAGRTELARALVGLDRNVEGEVIVDGHRIDSRRPDTCQKYGLVYVPEDRHAHGIFLERPSVETMTASILQQLRSYFLDFRKENSMGKQFIQQLRIQINNLSQVCRTLSGGNQQKIMLSKSLASKPKVIILDEPTRGIDVKARQDVYHIIQDLAQQGMGVLLISSDLEEVIQWSDRVYVMFQGKIVQELLHSECHIERIMAASFGAVGLS